MDLSRPATRQRTSNGRRLFFLRRIVWMRTSNAFMAPLNAESEQFSDHEQAGYPGMREAVLPGQCWRPLTQRCPRGRVQFVVIAYQSGLVRPARLRSLNAVSKDPASALRG